MKNLSYYADHGAEPNAMNSGSLASDAAPVIVNCTGNLDTGFAFTTHNTDGRLDYYLMYITGGELNVDTPCGTKTVSAGDAVIFPPRYKYRYSYDGKGEPLSYMWVHFTGSHALYYLCETGFDSLPAIRESRSCDTRVIAGFREMFDIFSKGEELYEHSLAATLIRILVALGKTDEKETPIARSLAYINASYTEDIRIPSLAAMDNLSNSRYHTLFTKATGRSPRKYITELRMRHAAELLRTTDLSVKQIGLIVGYPDPHFFSKMFKNNMGVPPLEYREG